MRLLAFVSLLFTAGAVLLQFFIVLSGAQHTGILRQFYWIRVHTDGISNAQPISEWTTYGICSYDGSSLTDVGNDLGCTKNKPDFPFAPYRNFGNTDSVPSDFVDHDKKYFYLSRFAWPFYIVSLFFGVVVLFIGLFSTVSSFVRVSSSLLSLVAWVFAAAAAALSTVAFVQGRKAFRNNNYDAKLGVKMFAFAWVPVFLYLVNTTLFCYSGGASADNFGGSTGGAFTRSSSGRYNSSSGGVYRFGFGSKKTNEGPAAIPVTKDADASSFVRAV